MLYTINRGNVAGYVEGQRPVIHLISSVQRVQDVGLPFVFTDGHGIVDFTEYFDDLTFLDRIDWPLMSSRFWNDIQSDSDRCRRRQAEFLVHEFFPFELVTEIGVINKSIKENVEETLLGTLYRPEVNIHPEWYY
jgi:hypothetical protein